MYTIREREELDRSTFVRIDWQWVNDQLSGIGYTGLGKQRVTDILLALEGDDFRHNEKEEVTKILDLARNLFLGIPVYEKKDELPEGEWVQAERGYISRKDTVRVKTDAYLGEYGIRHNGKVGRVVNVQGESISVIYEGDTIDDMVAHKIKNLLKKM